MSKYNFKIADYHAIKQANIEIDGITVLAGGNGSGKSTLSRWLYYVMNVATEFGDYLAGDYKIAIGRILKELSRVERDIGLETKEAQNYLFNFQKLSANTSNIEVMEKIVLACIEEYASSLMGFLANSNISNIQKQRVLSYLQLNPEKIQTMHSVGAFFFFYQNLIKQITKEIYQEIKKRDVHKLFQIVNHYFEETDEAPQNIQLCEDDVILLENNSIGSILNVDRVIYIDTPDGDNADNIFWKKLEQMIVNPFDMKLEDNSKELQFLKIMLTRILRGEINVEKNLVQKSELFYKREDGLNIPLSKVATGMKPFAYLMRLLQNGYLDRKTILLIDEPEAHLHPQWIVEFARVLVSLHSKLGVKVMIASHNPDMVAAIRAISSRQKILDRVHFYLAEKESENSFMYCFRDLGTSIEPIFESFNIALSRIQQYGDSNI